MDRLKPEIEKLFHAKEARRGRLAALPFHEKVRAVIQMQQVAAPIRRSRDEGAVRVYLQAVGGLTIVDSRFPTEKLRRDREDFDAVSVAADVQKQALHYTDDDLLDERATSLHLGELVDKRRTELIREAGDVARDITGTLHSRLAFSLSVFVLVILGAALGIVFRGAHVLTAFGISFLPSLFVICMIIMGKQLIDNPPTTALGVAVIWLGIGLVAAGDVYTLARVVRR